jgi:hypothetical protein
MTSDGRLDEPMMEDKSELDLESEEGEEIEDTPSDGEELEEVEDDIGSDNSNTMKSPPPSTDLNTENEEEDEIPAPQDSDSNEDKGQDSNLESDGLLPARYSARKKGKVGQAFHACRDR